MKKQLFLVALGALTMFTTSCKDNDIDNNKNNQGVVEKSLVVRIANSDKKAVGEGAVPNSIQVKNGIIFVVNTQNEVIFKEEIDVTKILGGQTLTKSVMNDSRVFIVANIPDAVKSKFMGETGVITVDQIKAEAIDISNADYGQKFENVTLSNEDGSPKDLTLSVDGQGNKIANVTVNIAPAYARIELQKISNKDGKDFEVQGVYVTDYYGKYTLGRGVFGAMHQQGQDTDFSRVIDVMKDEVAYPSVTGEAKPNDSKSWVYNVPAASQGVLSRLIIKVKMNDTQAIKYLTIARYKVSGSEVASLVPGKIYRLSNLQFIDADATDKPNDKNYTLTATASIVDWQFVDVDGEL